MNIKTRTLLLCAGLLVGLAACSRNKANPPEEPMAIAIPVTTITMVPIESPAVLFTDNRGAPVIGALLTGIANSVMDKRKTTEFDAAHSDYRKRIGERLTRALQHELSAQGFSVRLANAADVERNQDLVLNASKFIGHEAVLDVRIDSFAMYSGRLNSNYLPMINIYVMLFNPSSARTPILDTWYSYGAEADRTGDGYIQSDPRFTFPNFDSLMSQPRLVVESFDDGLQKITMHFMQDFNKQFKPTVPPIPSPVRQATVSGENDVSASTALPAQPGKVTKPAKGSKVLRRQPATPAPAASR
jgi:hypothetical protein